MYALLPSSKQTHLKEMFSVIYTPTEGDAIQNYSRLFRRPQGCFLSIDNQNRIGGESLAVLIALTMLTILL